MKNTIFTLGFCLCVLYCYAQDTANVFVHTDPIAKYKRSLTANMGYGITEANYQNPINLNSENYYVNRHTPGSSFQFGIDWGWLFYDKKSDAPMLLNVGLEENIASFHVFDSSKRELVLSELRISIPISFGYRLPLHTVKHHERYHAFEYKAGVDFFWAEGDNFSYWNDYTLPDYKSKQEYFGIGIIAQFEFSFLDKHGHGHVIGLRENEDLGKGAIWGAGKTTPPSYATFTLFYNIGNGYYHKK